MGYVVQCISLGRSDGLIQIVRLDDQPRERIITGRLGAIVKEQVVRYPVRMLKLERRFPGAYMWPRAARTDQHATGEVATTEAQADVPR